MINQILDAGKLVLGQYELEGLVGSGAMGDVYLARHQSFNKRVAIKVLHDTCTNLQRARFEREARLMASLSHPSIVQLLDYGTFEDGRPCIVMEYIEGEPLGAYLQRSKQLTWTKAATLAMQLAGGLTALHEQGIIHRDIKPDNIIYTSAMPRHAKMLDFGIARGLQATEEKLTQSGVLIGTPAYMAPEQLLGEVASKSSDMYSLGMLLHELMYGTLPFGSNTMKEIMLRLRKPAPIPESSVAGIPLELLSLLFDQLLAIEPEERVTSAWSVAQALDEIHDTYRRKRGETPTAGAFIFKRDKSARHKTRETSPTPPEQALTRVPARKERGDQNGSFVRDDLEPGTTPWTSTEPTPPPAPAPTPQLALLLARLPPSTLGNQTERHWLASQVNNHGRAFFYGGQFWICVLTGKSAKSLEDKVTTLERGLQERYGTLLKTTTRDLPEAFNLTAAHLSGLAPLPKELSESIAAVLS